MATSSNPLRPYVRLARADDLADIIKVAERAFPNDHVFTYLGSVQTPIRSDVNSRSKRALATFLRFNVRSVWVVGGRVTVVVVPVETTDNSPREKIVAATLWLPPHKRIHSWSTITLLRAGLLSVAYRWGLTGLVRLSSYQKACQIKLDSLYEAKGSGGSSKDAWYLQLAMTDPDYQGKGFFSLLLRETYAHAGPDATFTVESSGVARAHYIHLGFEQQDSIWVGVGKVCETGLPPSGAEEATGFESYPMVNWNNPPKL